MIILQNYLLLNIPSYIQFPFKSMYIYIERESRQTVAHHTIDSQTLQRAATVSIIGQITKMMVLGTHNSCISVGCGELELCHSYFHELRMASRTRLPTTLS